MPTVVGVKFKPGGKLFQFDSGILDVHPADAVVVETASGQSVATVLTGPCDVAEDNGAVPLRPVIRLATERDLQRKITNEARAAEALRMCAERVRVRALPMKLIDAEYTLDSSQVTINFAAENRVDFRDLVRDVASAIQARVIFHQVGARDHARALGMFGPCGQPVCCSRFLNCLEPISMRMAKDQSLSVNPSKFSGMCGKLMCCLRFEHDTYVELIEELPAVGDFLETREGRAEVLSVNADTGAVSARLADESIIQLAVSSSNGNGTCMRDCPQHAPTPEDNHKLPARSKEPTTVTVKR